MLDRMEDMREDLNHNDFADDASGAKKAIEAHNEAKRKILKVPVENIDNVGQRLLQRYACSVDYQGGDVHRFTSISCTLDNVFVDCLRPSQATAMTLDTLDATRRRQI